MSSELIAWVVALALGTAVVVLGLRRNLSETTRNGLPRFGGDSEQETAMLRLYEDGERQRRPFTRQQKRWFVPLYLLLALMWATSAVQSSHDRWIHAAAAALCVVGAVVFLLRKVPPPSGGLRRSNIR